MKNNKRIMGSYQNKRWFREIILMLDNTPDMEWASKMLFPVTNYSLFVEIKKEILKR